MPRKKSQTPVSDTTPQWLAAVPSDAAPAPDAPPAAEPPAQGGAALPTLDDVATLLVQLEPGDDAELERARLALMRLARETEDMDVAFALGGAATQLAACVAGTDAAQRAASLARANKLVETAMSRLDAIAAAAPAVEEPPIEHAPVDEAAADAALGEALADALDDAWAEVADELDADEQLAASGAHAAGPDTPPAPLALPPDLDLDLLRDFITESRDCISAAEAALLALESDPDDAEAINTVFRAFHTIKGTAAFMGLAQIADFAHHAESLLSLVRDREIAFSGHCADLSLRSADMIVGMLQDVEDALAGDPLAVPDELASLTRELIALCEGKADATTSVAPAPAPSRGEWRGAERRQGDRRQGDRRQGGDRRADAAAEQSVRVRTDRLDRLIDMVGELVIAQSMIAQDPTVLSGQDAALAAKVTHATKLVRDLQDLSMSMRMVPLKPTFQKLARLVRDLAQKAGKQVELVTDGEDTEIDRNMVDVVGDPLVHMVRNAVDHGLETPAERIAAGKPPVGVLRLSAYHAGGSVVVDLQDDGRGLNRTKILAKARDRGLVSGDRYMTDGEVYDLIFAPGFSTADQITDVSGRGVGMDVVRRNVESLRGRVDIASEQGQGTTFSVRLPLTLAITDGMLVRVGQERYIVPTAAIHMSFRPERGMLSTINGRGEVVLLRDELMPVVRVHRLLEIPDAVTDPSGGILMIVGDQDKRTALLVDELLGQHQLVVKSLGGNLGAVPGVSGAAILGDGRVGLILDLPGLVALARTRGGDPVDPLRAVA